MPLGIELGKNALVRLSILITTDYSAHIPSNKGKFLGI